MEKCMLIILMCILNRLAVMVNHFKIQILISNKMPYNFNYLTNFKGLLCLAVVLAMISVGSFNVFGVLIT